MTRPCPVCGKLLRENKDGTLRKHSRKLGAGPGTFLTERCPASNRRDWGQ